MLLASGFKIEQSVSTHVTLWMDNYLRTYMNTFELGLPTAVAFGPSQKTDLGISRGISSLTSNNATLDGKKCMACLLKNFLGPSCSNFTAE